MNIIFIILFIIIIYIYSNYKKNNVFDSNTPYNNNTTELNIFIPKTEWLKSYNLNEYNRFIHYCNKLQELSINTISPNPYDKIVHFKSKIINIFHSLIHSLNNSKDINLFNQQLSDLEDILIKYTSINNNLYRLYNRINPINDQSKLNLTNSLEEDNFNPKTNYNYDWVSDTK
jgi:hypothetical protein